MLRNLQSFLQVQRLTANINNKRNRADITKCEACELTVASTGSGSTCPNFSNCRLITFIITTVLQGVKYSLIHTYSSPESPFKNFTY